MNRTHHCFQEIMTFLRPSRTDLGDKIVSELGVFDHGMWDIKWKEINESLDFVDHGLCVGHLAPICHGGASVSANHTVNLLLNFLCWEISKC